MNAPSQDHPVSQQYFRKWIIHLSCSVQPHLFSWQLLLCFPFIEYILLLLLHLKREQRQKRHNSSFLFLLFRSCKTCRETKRLPMTVLLFVLPFMSWQIIVIISPRSHTSVNSINQAYDSPTAIFYTSMQTQHFELLVYSHSYHSFISQSCFVWLE